MQKYLKGKGSLFKQIMIHEDLHSSTMMKDVPIDMETTWIGNDMQTLVSCFVGQETVHPYSDVSLRLIMRMADLLMGNRHCYNLDLDATSKDIDDLSNALIDD